MSQLLKNMVLLATIILLSCTLRTYCQTEINIGAGVSDIAFKLTGEKVYLGYEINALTHNLPSFSYYISLSQGFWRQSRVHPVVEFQYARVGLNYSTSYLFDDLKYYIKIHYLKIPVLLMFNLSLKNSNNSGLLFGPYFSYRLLANRLLTVQGKTDKKKVDNVKPIDLGLMAGYNRDINLANFPLKVGVTISYSVVNIMTPIDGVIMLYDGPENEYARNITVLLSIGYKINKDR